MPSRRIALRSWPASRANAAAFIASTGNTQGIRFRIRPPSSANSSASTSDRLSPPFDAVSGARRHESGIELGDHVERLALLAIAGLLGQHQRARRSTAGAAALASPFLSGMRMPSAVTLAVCLAMLATGPHSAGKK